MVGIYVYIVHYILTTDLNKLDVINNCWDVTGSIVTNNLKSIPPKHPL